MARSYTQNRAERIARIFGEPFDVLLNDGAPFHCITGVPAPEVQRLANQAIALIQAGKVPGDYTNPEYALRSIIDPAEHDRLSAEFRSTDPALVIVITDEEVGTFIGDFLSYLAGGIPFERPEPSPSGPSPTGGNSEPSTAPSA